MEEDRILLSELIALFFMFSTPAFVLASLGQIILLARAGLWGHDRHRIWLSALLSLVLAIPLALLLWWLMNFLPSGAYAFLGALPASEIIGIGTVIFVPSIVASIIVYTIVGWITLKRARATEPSPAPAPPSSR